MGGMIIISTPFQRQRPFFSLYYFFILFSLVFFSFCVCVHSTIEPPCMHTVSPAFLILLFFVFCWNYK